MSRTWFLLILSMFDVQVLGQQVGGANRDYSINGWGSGLPSGTRAPIVPLPGIMSNRYTTLDPNAPVIWARSPLIQIGWVQTPTNSIDLSPAGLEIIANGTLPGWLSGLFRTSFTGTYSLSLPVTSALHGGWHIYSMAHVAGTSPDGFWVSQAVYCRFLDCSAVGQTLTLSDDSYLAVALSTPIRFYGVTYSNVFVESNGCLTFGFGSGAYLESVASLLSGPPRIAVFWDDLDPSASGSVSAYQFSAGPQDVLEVCWQAVPEFSIPQPSTNTLMVRFYEPLIPTAARVTHFFYGGITAQDGLVGLSPGNGLTSAATSIDVSGPTIPLTFGHAVYEIFAPGLNPCDLEAENVVFWFDANGYPTTLHQN